MAEPKSKKPSPTQRTPAQKSAAFKELANARVNKSLKALRQLKYLANTSTYAYTPAEVELIVSTLRGAVNEVTTAFADPKSAKSEGFKLG